MRQPAAYPASLPVQSARVRKTRGRVAAVAVADAVPAALVSVTVIV